MSRLLIIIAVIFSVPFVNAQPKFNRQPVKFDKIILPADSSSTVFITYQIPFENLVFTKVGEKYESGISLTFEISDSSKIITRHSAEKKVTVDEFEDTKDEARVLRGITSIELPNINLDVNPLIRSLEKFKPVALNSFTLNLTTDSLSEILEPISVKNGNVKDGFDIFGNEGAIPFSAESYPILVPIENTNLKSVEVVILQEEKEIIKLTADKKFLSDMLVSESGNKLLISPSDHGAYSVFILDGISQLLGEGTVEFQIQTDGLKKSFSKSVIWINKPFSLLDPEGAIKLLSNVTSEEKVDDLLDYDEEEYYSQLKKFWRKFDESKKTPFNEVMNEFYSRADYAREHFSTTNRLDGAKTDRGLIFIKYGNPSNIERDYSSMNNTIEIWHYAGRKFIFADRTGLGNYKLVKS